MKTHRNPTLYALNLATALAAAALSATAKTFDWPIDAPTAGARQFTAYHGETVRFNLRLGGAMTNLAPVAIYYQTNGMGRAEWFTAPGTVFHPTNDCGAAVYRFFILCNDPDGRDYTANGSLRLLDSPGFEPSAVQLPVKTLDFAKVEVINPPWGEGPGNYAAVSNAAMNAAQNATNLVADATNGIPRITESSIGPGVAFEAENAIYATYAIDAESAKTAGSADMANAAMVLRGPHDDSARTAVDIFAQLDAATETNAAQAAALESQSSQLSQQSQSITTLGSQVNAIGAHLNAEDARFVATNYNSATRLPEAYVEVKITENGVSSWLTVWREMTCWDWFLGVYTNDFAALSAALADKGEKEYAFYDGVTGDPAPDGFFWISQPRVAIAAGASYQRYVDTGGAVWVLESNGMVADINGTTNGFFRVSDDDGNVQFEIVKGNARTVVAAPGAVTHESVMGVTHWFATYAVTNAASAPVAMFCRDIGRPEWYAESDGDCPCNVSWTNPESGVYVCEWWAKGTEPQMFMKAEYGQGSESRIVQTAPVQMQHIVINGVKGTLGTATIDGKTVLTFTP